MLKATRHSVPSGRRAPLSVEFSLPDRGYERVYLCSNLTCWLPGALRMVKRGGRWVVALDLPEGYYEYAFVADGEWLIDPENSQTTEVFGNPFSVAVIGEDVMRAERRLGDSKIVREAIFHGTSVPYVDPYVEDEGELVALRLRTLAGDVESVRLLINGERLEPDEVLSDGSFDYHSFTVELKRASYYFEIRDGSLTEFYGSLGFSSGGPRPFVLNPDLVRPPAIPDWVIDSIFYQIFPDRFWNGDPSNDPPGVKPWGSPPDRRTKFGGDLQGIVQKLDYLVKLGINAIYLNPIHPAQSYHGYDITDYFRVAEHLGGEEALRELVERAHERGVRVVLDGVFHHTGSEHPAFREALVGGPRSSWYLFKRRAGRASRLLARLGLSLPHEVRQALGLRPPYETFAGVWEMPKLNFDCHEVREFVKSVAAYWLREFGVDGWRLDVANGIPAGFWVEFREAVKRENRDAYILAELPCDPYLWVRAGLFDGWMNYALQKLVLAFFIKGSIDAAEFDRGLASLRLRCPRQILFGAYNLLSSHDTPRILTEAGGDSAKIRPAVIFQFTYLGVPAIYYGDEVGMQGGGDPLCRAPMVWDIERWDLELLELHRKLATLRRDLVALRRGWVRPLMAKGDLYAFLRTHRKGDVAIALNRSRSPVEVELPLRGSWKEVLNRLAVEETDFGVFLRLPPLHGAILTQRAS